MILNIDFVSDFVCPWCFLGKVRLERALTELLAAMARSNTGALLPMVVDRILTPDRAGDVDQRLGHVQFPNRPSSAGPTVVTLPAPMVSTTSPGRTNAARTPGTSARSSTTVAARPRAAARSCGQQHLPAWHTSCL